MYRSTTPTLILKIKNENFDFETIKECHVTIESESKQTELLITNPTIDSENRRIMITLTQEQTLKFNVGIIKVQLKIKLKSGAVIPSVIVKTTMKEILEEAIM
jgi:hypothetical protein